MGIFRQVTRETVPKGHLSASDDLHAAQDEHMTNPTADPAAYTDEELKRALARVLELARSDVLDDTEVQKFWQLYAEIVRRRAATGNAA
jgi:hypothetical protein